MRSKRVSIGLIVVVAALAGPSVARAETVGINQLDWSVPYIIDTSQPDYYGNIQSPGPRDNRGLALSPDGRYLYAGYNNGPEVRKIDLTAPDVISANVAQTNAVRGKAIAVDDVGRVYLAEGSTIEVYDADLTASMFSIPIVSGTSEGVAVVREGGQLILYHSNRTTGLLKRRVLTESGGLVTGAAVDLTWGTGSDGDIGLNDNLRGVEVDSSGRIWVADIDAQVFVVAADGTTFTSVPLDSPMDIGFDDTNAFVTQYDDRTITVVDLTTLDVVTQLTVPWADLALDPDGQSGGGALSGIAMAGSGFYVANEAGQTADEKSTYGLTDDESGFVGSDFYTDTGHDDNDPILFAQTIPEPGTMLLLGTALAGIGGFVVRRRRRS